MVITVALALLLNVLILGWAMQHVGEREERHISDERDPRAP